MMLYASRIESPKGREARLSLKSTVAVPPQLLPPLPAAQLPGAQLLPRVAVLSPPRPQRLVWECPAIAFSNLYVTGIVGSTNLRDWYEVARLPYQLTNTVTLTNRPGYREFYRAFNGMAP